MDSPGILCSPVVGLCTLPGQNFCLRQMDLYTCLYHKVVIIEFLSASEALEYLDLLGRFFFSPLWKGLSSIVLKCLTKKERKKDMDFRELKLLSLSLCNLRLCIDIIVLHTIDDWQFFILSIFNN